MAARGDYGRRGPGRLVTAGVSSTVEFVKPDQDVSAGVLSAPDNVFSVWKGPAFGVNDADTGRDIEADYATQDFVAESGYDEADYCVATLKGGKWYVSCFIPSATGGGA